MVEINEQTKSNALLPFEEITKLGHEQVVFCYDEPTGLKAIIGIHNTVLGPALGGTRMWNYASESEALTDVLRLSRGMTYKAAISGLNLGGGKAVIIGDPAKLKNEAFLRRFGRFVNSLGGRYVTAEDVNMKTSDMVHISYETDFVTGLPETMGGGGDPSPVTAYGTYLGMKASAKKVYGSDSLAGKKVAVQGVGQVGKSLVKHLIEEGAIVSVADISEGNLKYVTDNFKVNVVGLNDVYNLDVDIYAPCALGATLNDNTISQLKCKIIAGAANNQLEDELRHGRQLSAKGIVYAPDFLINAGGLINVCAEFEGEYNREVAYTKAEQIYDTCTNIFAVADKENITTQEAAIKLAQKRIDDMAKVKMSY